MDLLLHDHRRQSLRHGHGQHPVDAHRLHHGERRVGRSRRQIDDGKVEAVPGAVLPELLDRAADQRSAPDDGRAFVAQEQIDRQHFDALRRSGHLDLVVLNVGRLIHAQQARDGRTGDIGVKHADAVSGAVQRRGKQRRDCALAHASLAAADRDDAAHALTRGRRDLRAVPRRRAGAAGTVARFTHFDCTSPERMALLYSFFSLLHAF